MAKKELSKEEIELTKQNFDEYKLKYNCAQKVFFKCEKCGAISRKAIKVVHDLLCRKCLIEKTAIERYGSLANMQKINLEHGKATKLERYGDENYVNKEKAVATSKARFGENNYNNRFKCKETLKERYGVENCSQIEGNSDKVKATKLEKYGDENYVNSEKNKQTCLEKYGVENISQLDSTKQKVKSTCLERYGVENVMQLDMFREMSKHTCLKKYGTEFPSQAESVKLKAVNTSLEKYGVEYPLQAPDIKEKLKQTCIDRYNVDNPMKVNDIKEKVKSTHYERNGVPYPMQVESTREKAKRTCEERYGVSNFAKSDIFRSAALDRLSPQNLKRVETLKERYSSTNLGQFHYKYVYDGEAFDSSWELYYWVYCQDNGLSIQRNNKEFLVFHFNGKECHYYPDFKVNNEFVEIKGDHFFAEDGRMQCPFDHSLDALFEAKHQCMLNNKVKILRKSDILLFKEYVDKKYTEDFIKLFNTKAPFPYSNYLPSKKSLYKVLKYFHKSIYNAKKDGYLSPVEAWSDKELVKKSALNRLKYVGKCSPKDVVAGFTIAKIAPKVSVFKPELAKTLIKKYLNEYSCIVDPFSGFSGRLLGAHSCGKSYVGYDLNEEHVRESNEIIKFLGIDNATVQTRDILSEFKVETYDCLFTCPPYSNKEKWNKNETCKTCDEWIDICLNKYKCDKYLFVVDDTEKYKNNIVETITNRSHFGENFEYVILI